MKMKKTITAGNAHVGTAPRACPERSRRGCPVERSSTSSALKVREQRRNGIILVALLLALPIIVQAQDIKIPPDVEKLSARAKETVEVTMDGPMLRWASKFLSAEDPEEQKCAKLVANLKGIYVRSYEFDKDGAYSTADLESLRSLVHGPNWNRVVGVRSEHDGDNVDVFFKLEDDKMAGIVVIAAEARELTFVSIVGPIEVDQLADLGGEFGIPRLDVKESPGRKPSKAIAKTEKGDHK